MVVIASFQVRLAKEKTSNKLYAMKIMNKDFLKKRQAREIRGGGSPWERKSPEPSFLPSLIPPSPPSFISNSSCCGAIMTYSTMSESCCRRQNAMDQLRSEHSPSRGSAHHPAALPVPSLGKTPAITTQYCSCIFHLAVEVLDFMISLCLLTRDYCCAPPREQGG